MEILIHIIEPGSVLRGRINLVGKYSSCGWLSAGERECPFLVRGTCYEKYLLQIRCHFFLWS
ncbi:unnamed protein product [Coffea canephora]|uniref:DH200=94 genomic scaffold, scaffold_185 n=1 Tax=Coffea canephora TaxID=49390 RepID=A0A068VAV3_COFCA|nr:unnamed protein product [Coffea canephora]